MTKNRLIIIIIIANNDRRREEGGVMKGEKIGVEEEGRNER